MTATRFNVPTGWRQEGRPFHHGVVAPEGKILHVTGQVAWDQEGQAVGPGDCEAQMRRCFENVESILEAVGGRLEDIVSLTIYYLDPADLPAIQKVRAEKIPLEQGPVSILIQAAGLVAPELLVELVPIAVVPEDRYCAPPASRARLAEGAETRR